MNNDNEVVTKGYLDESFEKFAVIINGAFAKQQKYMDERFEKVEARLDNVENKLDKVEVRLSGVEYIVDKLQDQVEISNKNQTRFEKRITKLETAAI